MRARSLLATALVGGVVGATGACSITTATGFTDCATAVQCGSAHACLQGYCIPLPERCQRLEGAFDRPDHLPIAALLPLTVDGVPDPAEGMRVNALRLALSEVNERDGLRGRRFGLYACDTARAPDALAEQLRWFITEMGVPVVLTSGSPQTLAAARSPHVRDAGTLVVAANASSPELITAFAESPAVWRTAPPDTLQGVVLAALLRTEPRYVAARRIGIIHEGSDYGDGVAGALLTAVTRDGKTASAFAFALDAGVVDANQVLNQLVPFNPEVTALVASPRDVRSIVRAARARFTLTRDAGHQWMLSDAAKDPAVLDATTTLDLNGTFGTAPAQGAGPGFPGFSRRFTERYPGTDPKSAAFTAHAYDAMYLVMLSAAWASSTGVVSGRAMSEGMRRLSASGVPPYELVGTSWVGAAGTLATGASIDVEGASSSLDFDVDAGAPAAPYEVWQVVDGGFVSVRLLLP